MLKAPHPLALSHPRFNIELALALIFRIIYYKCPLEEEGFLVRTALSGLKTLGEIGGATS